jgi:hypothetical protein
MTTPHQRETTEMADAVDSPWTPGPLNAEGVRHKFVLLVDELNGIGQGVLVDGVELWGVRECVVSTKVYDLTTVTVTFLTNDPVEMRKVPNRTGLGAKTEGDN